MTETPHVSRRGERSDRSGTAPRTTPSARSAGRSLAVVVAVLAVSAAMARAGSQGGATVGGVPVFTVVVGWIFLVQFAAFLPAWLAQTERYFDLVGSLTFVTAILGALILTGHTDLPALLLAGAVVVWAARLGSFLFARVRRSGGDNRFEAITPDAPRFLVVWVTQGLWVTLTLSAVLAAVTATERPGLSAVTIVGLVIWILGFAVEVAADLQKKRFRADPANKTDFIRTGLWAWSRHPNYFGEIVAWLGLAVAALPALRGWQYATLVSPVFVLILLTRVSGIPLLERKADARWGGHPGYQEYRASTSVLVLLPPRKPRTGVRTDAGSGASTPGVHR